MNRLNTIKLDHREANLSIDGVTTSNHAFTTPNNQTLRIIVADGRNDENGDTIIWPASFGSRADHLEEARTSVLAARTEARVAYIETPGVGLDINDPSHTDAGKLTRRQLMSVANGNFDSLASTQLDALDDVLEFKDQQEVRFIGYSMGSWATATMAKLLARHHFPDKQLLIPRIDLIEPVNDQNYKLNDLRHKINQEDQYSERYFMQENSENGLDVLPFDRESELNKSILSNLNWRQFIALKALSMGIRRGFANNLTKAVAESDDSTRLMEGSIHLWRANESLVARPDANRRTINQLGRVGRMAAQMTEIYPTMRDKAKGHHHALVHSMGNIANMAERHLKQESRVAY